MVAYKCVNAVYWCWMSDELYLYLYLQCMCHINLCPKESSDYEYGAFMVCVQQSVCHLVKAFGSFFVEVKFTCVDLFEFLFSMYDL
jgi:hypothetical protein